MTSDPVPITGLIDTVLGRLARADVAPVVRLRLEWDHVAGSWSTRCRPVSLRNGVLSVVVVSGLEATRLRYDAAGLVTRAAATLGDAKAVTALAVRVATQAEQAAAARNPDRVHGAPGMPGDPPAPPSEPRPGGSP